MRLLVLYFFTTFVDYTKTETDSNVYHGPPPYKELFSYHNHVFHLHSLRCSYVEAKVICEAGNMHLATLDEPGKAKFAAESIAEAWMVFDDMWIGAQKVKRGQWKWDFTGKSIPEEITMSGNYTYYPPWVDNEIPSRDGKDCLAIDRNNHNNPYFVDLDCTLPRPFICEENGRPNNIESRNSGIVEIFNIQFILYHGRLSWAEAVSFCRQHGYALATVENMSIARELAKAMLKSRPQFEDAWIGANLKDGQWRWVETGKEIKTLSTEYKVPHKGEVAENIITPQFPPWFEWQNKKSGECVMFDRHSCEEPKFINMKCNRQRDFICIKRDGIAETEKTLIVDRKRKRYTFFFVAATWDEAREICDRESQDTTMLHLSDSEEIKFIMQTMSDAKNPIDHVWLGGNIQNEKWVWVGRRDSEYSETVDIPIRPDETGFPPWCDNDTKFEMGCLNLDRKNHWTPLIYGIECNSTQTFVCVKPIGLKDMIVTYEGSGKDDLSVKVRITKLQKNAISWYDAKKVCERDVGKLWRPKFDLPDSSQPLARFFTNILTQLKKEKEKEQDDSNFVEFFHLDAGKYSFKQKTWTYNGKAINITNVGWEPQNGDCLVGQINKTAAQWSWFPVKCYHKLYSQVICQPYCSLSEVPYEQEKSDWMCDAASSVMFDHKMTEMRCNHRCPNNTVKEGPEQFYCDKTAKGWVSAQHRSSVASSQCKNLKDGLDFFDDVPSGLASLVFVTDSTSNSPKDYNAIKYLVGNLIDFYHSSISNITVSVVSIELDLINGERAVTKIKDYVPSEDCSKIKKDVLDSLTDTGEDATDYAAGLSKVSEVLGETELNQAHVVFIVPKGNQGGSYKDKARVINEKARVYAIGTNRHVSINQLVDVASKNDNKVFAIQFQKPPDVVAAVNGLMARCPKCKCANAFNDLTEEIDYYINRETELPTSARLSTKDQLDYD